MKKPMPKRDKALPKRPMAQPMDKAGPMQKGKIASTTKNKRYC